MAFCLVNKKTGQTFVAKYNRLRGYKLACKKILNYLNFHYKKFYRVLLSLNMAEARNFIPQDERRAVLRFIRESLKAKGSDFVFIASNEIQLKRMAKYGDVACHLHIICFYTVAGVFPAAWDIEPVWSLGQADIQPPRKGESVEGGFKYLQKYLSPDESVNQLFKKGSRLFTSSRIPHCYNLEPDLLRDVMAYYPLDILEKCYWEREGLIIYTDGERQIIVEMPKSDWSRLR